MNRFLFPVTSALLVLFLSSCRDQEVVAYRVPKETDPKAETPPAARAEVSAVPVAAGPMSGTPVATASGAGLSWTAPAHWQTKSPGAMRKGSYSITGADGSVADLSITAFPGDVGGESANVNRWRGQLQLAPLTDAEVASAITRRDENGLKVGWVELASVSGAAPTRLLGAMVPFGGATWFFKLLGPDATVAAEKPAFLNFLTTLKPAGASTP
ncbi:MAG: hypothetical protein ABIZ04_00400 [Opitutus sp.]